MISWKIDMNAIIHGELSTGTDKKCLQIRIARSYRGQLRYLCHKLCKFLTPPSIQGRYLAVDTKMSKYKK